MNETEDGLIDEQQYEQYKDVLIQGDISLDALRRMVKHDISHQKVDPATRARAMVLRDADNGGIPYKKEHDEVGDLLYGVKWPVPMHFRYVEKRL